MALVGLVRVSTDKQNTQRQHDALDSICLKVFEEKISGKLAVDDRPALKAALEYIRNDDMLCVQEVDRLGRNLLEGLIVLNDLFERGISVKVLEGIAAGEHTERTFILDLALALAEDRRRDIVKKTKNGLESARKQGRVGGRKPVMTEVLIAQAVALRDKGFTIRQIQPHLRIAEGANKGKNPSVGAISQALQAYDATKEAAK
jgi:DNA invertase Pin-like site-specific DNA recombinase